MDNVQKHNTCNNTPSSQTFRSYDYDNKDLASMTESSYSCVSRKWLGSYYFQIVVETKNITERMCDVRVSRLKNLNIISLI
jgi:aminopeptidase C